MLRILFLSFLFIISYSVPCRSQSGTGKWEKWEYLLGNWKGEGNGNPGMGEGTFTFSNALSDNILIRKSLTSFPASENRPAFTHEDLMIIYADPSGIPSHANYFDNEGHSINYSIVYSGEQIILTSEQIPNIPRFRLTYQKLDEQNVNVVFAIAPPQSPEDFKIYLEGKSVKIK